MGKAEKSKIPWHPQGIRRNANRDEKRKNKGKGGTPGSAKGGSCVATREDRWWSRAGRAYKDKAFIGATERMNRKAG